MEFTPSDIVSLLQSMEDLSPVVRYPLIAVFFGVIGKMRDRKHDKNTESRIVNATSIQKIVDKAEEIEKAELELRVDDILRISYGRLYSAMESYVYSGDFEEWSEIEIIRNKIKRKQSAKDYLADHHSATKNAFFKTVKPFIIKQLVLHNVAESTQETATNDAIAVEAREMVLARIHIEAGCNNDTKKVEDSILTFESMLDTYMQISKECVLLREKRKQDVENAIGRVK